MEALEREIKTLIVECLKLEGVTADAIDSEAPLFVDGLGLDSIDALELAMEIRKRYGVRTSTNEAENRTIFATVRSLAAWVAEQRRAQTG